MTKPPWPSPEVATPKQSITQPTPDESKEWAEKYSAENPERTIEAKDEKEYRLRRDVEAKEPEKAKTINIVPWPPEETAALKEFVENNPDKDALELAEQYIADHPSRRVEAVQQRIFKLRRTEPIVPRYSQTKPTE